MERAAHRASRTASRPGVAARLPGLQRPQLSLEFGDGLILPPQSSRGLAGLRLLSGHALLQRRHFGLALRHLPVEPAHGNGGVPGPDRRRSLRAGHRRQQQEPKAGQPRAPHR